MNKYSFAKTYTSLKRVAAVGSHTVIIWGVCTIALIALDLVNALVLGDASRMAMSNEFDVMLRQIIIVSCVFLARFVFTGIRGWVRGRYRQRIMLNFRAHTMQTLVHAKLSWFRKQSTGDILERFGTNMHNATEMMAGESLDFIEDILRTILGASLMAAINWRIALAYFATYPLIMLVQACSSKPTEKSYQTTFAYRGEFMGACQSYVENAALIQAYDYSARAQDIAAHKYAKYEAAYKRTWRIGLPGMVVSMILSLIPVLAFAYVSYVQYRSGAVDLPTLFSLMIIIIPLYGVVSGLYDRMLRLRERLASCARLIELWEAPMENSAGDSVEYAKDAPIVRFEHVSFSYNEKDNAVSDVSLTINRNERVAIVGESGCGKSTLLRLLLRLDEPSDGAILFEGKAASGYALDEYRARFAYVPQEASLFSGSIRQNLRYGKPDATDAELVNACKAAHIWYKIARLDSGLDAALAESGQTFSGGERQRLSIARALLRDADVILLDEATASLDKETADDITNQFLKDYPNKTILLVTHVLKTWNCIDRVIVMQNGRIVEDGCPRDLLLDSDSYLHKLAHTRDEREAISE